MRETGVHQGAIAQAAAHEYVSLEDILQTAADRGEQPLIMICDGLTDPHNLGAVIRSAETAGAHGVIIPKRRSVGLTATAAKASAGAIEHIGVARVTNLSAAIDTLKEKQKIGYCDNAEYYYVQSSNSTTNKMLYSYFLFEHSMKLWEREFSEFSEHVPYYIQALYISDLNWKLRANKLLPYHYDEARYHEAWNRIVKLLRRCDDEIIINHPNVLREHRLYWLSKKKSNNCHVEFGKKRIDVFCNNGLVVSEKNVHLTIEQCRVEGNDIKLSGTLIPLYSSIVEDVSLQLLCGLSNRMIPVPLKPSSRSRFHTHEISNQFFNFEVSIDTTVIKKFRFVVIANGERYETDMHFSNRVPFRRRRNDSLIRDKKELRYSFRANGFIVRDLNLNSADAAKRKLWLFQKIALEDIGSAIKQYRLEAKKKRTSPIWLYYDCKNVRKDNSFYQFEHDVYKNDGIQRFYILDGDDFKERKKEFPAALQKHIVRFGSRKHVN